MREVESHTKEKQLTRYCGIAYFYESSLVASYFVFKCKTPEEALELFEFYFKDLFKGAYNIEKVRRIEVLPQGAGRWDNVPAVLVKYYE